METDESSRVLSNHCTLAVITAFWWSVIRCRDKLHILSERIGFRLYAIAEDPICVDSKGSSSSYGRRCVSIQNPEKLSLEPKHTLRFASNRMSVAILCAVAPKLANGARTSMSILREYVWDVTG